VLNSSRARGRLFNTQNNEQRKERNVERLTCPKCRGDMEEGFRIDATHGGVYSEQWMPGPPQKSFWFGTKVDKEQLRQVKTYCCTQCGYLESYAKK
jgi:predicted nucleic-acid-binding Zn-ribbon protein